MSEPTLVERLRLHDIPKNIGGIHRLLIEAADRIEELEAEAGMLNSEREKNEYTRHTERS
jgi:hypothetical protein